MTISAGLRTFDASESNIVENFGQCGSSALPPYHGVMVRLRCQSIVRAFGGECPENPRAFVRHRHTGDVEAMLALDGLHPSIAHILFMSRAAYHRSRPVHQESPQIAVTPLADAKQPRVSA
jgi:hypothetical protein